MRVLISTKIFPNVREPGMAPYNRHQFQALARLCDVRLLASIPWFPGESWVARRRGRAWADVPDFADNVAGLPVRHPRVLYLPRVGQAAAGLTYAASLWPVVRKWRGQVDVLLAAFAYPDGFAGALLAKALGVPLVVKVHGSDINVIPERRELAPLVRWTMRSAYAVVGPSRPLVDRAISLGANPTTSRVILNGIDKSIFHPQDRAAARRELGLDPASRQILFIGRPEPAKGCDELLTAMARVKSPDERPVELVIVGDGPHTAGYRQRATELGLKVAFMGVRPHASMPSFLAACDLLVLPSWAEGTPNVLIEALACGRRVVATDVGGIPYVVNKPELGVLVRPKDSAGLAAALESVLATPYEPTQVAASMGFGDWSQSAAELEAVLSAAVSSTRSRSPNTAQQSERPVGSAAS